jgi:SWIM zinc finger
MRWTVDQVLSLAPNASAAKAGRGLATLGKWASLGQSDVAVWGECQGSAAEPYRAGVDLTEPAFRCSCPSRQFPCKHSLGLLLLFAVHAEAVPAGAPPAWLEDWLAGRAQRAARAAAPPSTDPARLREASAKRAEQRLARIGDGIDEIERWLADLVRAGLRELPARPVQYWEHAAARMVDAQAPGIARQLREMAVLPYGGTDWPDRILARVGRLHLLVQAWRRLDSLPPELRHQVLAEVGVAESAESVLAEGRRRADDWLVVGRLVAIEDRLRVQRTWLYGLESGRPALLLDHAHLSQVGGLDLSLVLGTAFRGELAFYPGALRLRAVVAARDGAREMPAFPGDPSLAAALGGFADLLARSPFGGPAPMALSAVVPCRSGDGTWLLRDVESAAVPIVQRAGWTLMALSGGAPIGVFGEWDGERLDPLSAWAGGRLARLGTTA